jgi:hypothetical protein
VSGRNSLGGRCLPPGIRSEKLGDGGTPTTATTCSVGANCWSLFTTMVLFARTCVLQQECDWGIFPEPHNWTMSVQQLCSWAVIIRSGIVHASNGAADQ